MQSKQPNKIPLQSPQYQSQPKRNDQKTNLAIQRQIQILYESAKQKKLLKKYKKIKYLGFIWCIGQIVQIKAFNNKIPHVAKILNFFAILDERKSTEQEDSINCLVMEVQRYMKKSQVLTQKKYERLQPHLSGNQIFASGQTYILPLQGLYAKCQMLTIDQYAALKQADQNLLFTRFSYNKNTKEFNPDPFKIPNKYCVCQNPYNPDLQYCQCDYCPQWYHNDCVIKLRSFDEQKFMCPKCLKKEKNQKHSKK